MENILTAVITGVFALIGTSFTCLSTFNKLTSKIELQQAITDTKLEELTREVREHNNFAKRMPVVEEKISVINHRIGDLENERKIS